MLTYSIKGLLLVLPNDYLCHVIPVKDIAWVGPLKSKKKLMMEMKKRHYLMSVFLQEILFYMLIEMLKNKSISRSIISKIQI